MFSPLNSPLTPKKAPEFKLVIACRLRDNTIKMWDRQTLQQYSKVLTGHTGSVLCLQYDDKVIISGSKDSTVRVWDVETGDLVNTLTHHREAVHHLFAEEMHPDL